MSPPNPPAKSNGVPLPLQADSTAQIDALYFHVPFCFHKCHYCDFYSIVDAADGHAASPTAHPARQEPFLNRLLAELSMRCAQAIVRPRTIFVGGGTPTLLAPALWERWLTTMRDAGILDRVTEFTVEANPETVTPELMRVLVRGGVNRVSLGAQSFQPELLKTLERWHDPSAVAQAVAIVREAGIANFNLDLIFAIPGETPAMLDADLDAALALSPTHLSCYSLIFEPNTAMNQRMKLGQVTPMDEEGERAMYGQVIDRLARAGFEHYEVSNWARVWHGQAAALSGLPVVDEQGASPRANGPERPPARATQSDAFRCLHNLIYWENHNWLGIGPGAASHVAGYRWKNEPHLGRYLASTGEPPTIDHEHLDADASLGEQLMLRLRLREGVPLDWLSPRLLPGDARRAAIEELLRLNMLERTATHLRLTEEGLFVADAVLAKLL